MVKTVALAATALSVVLTVTPADPGQAPSGGGTNNQGVGVWDSDTSDAPASGEGAPTDSGPVRAVKVFRVCQNGEIHDDVSDDIQDVVHISCDFPEAQCVGQGPDAVYTRIFTATAPGANPLQGNNTWRCLTPGQASQAIRFTGVTQADFRRLPIQAPQPIVQPPNGKTLVNVRTNVYTTPNPQTLNTTLLELPILIRATPVHYSWDFGNGHTLGTSDPGAPYPDLRTTHTYTKSGEYSISLATTYTGQYSLDGGATWANVQGTATVASNPIPITVMEIKTELTTGNQ